MGIGNIGWTEFLVILAIALIFFGPRRLPGIAQSIGKSLREFQKALNEVKSEIAQAGREADTRAEITRIPPGPAPTGYAAEPPAPQSAPEVTREAEVVVEDETGDQEEEKEVRVTPKAPPDSSAVPSPEPAAEAGSGTSEAEADDADSRDPNRA
jgi:TatA/E family protein of Tat protein translocase